MEPATAVVIALIVTGLLLLFLEFLLPGFVAGTVGIVCLIAAVVVGYREYGAPTGHYILFGVLVALGAGMVLWLRFFPGSRMAQPFVSTSQVGDIRTERPELVGQIGVAHTTLRPSGTAIIGGKRVDVVTDGVLIERGTPIKVIAVEGLRVVVRPTE
jgi:membrane-bound serine protease (ClpP class)